MKVLIISSRKESTASREVNWKGLRYIWSFLAIATHTILYAVCNAAYAPAESRGLRPWWRVVSLFVVAVSYMQFFITQIEEGPPTSALLVLLLFFSHLGYTYAKAVLFSDNVVTLAWFATPLWCVLFLYVSDLRMVQHWEKAERTGQLIEKRAIFLAFSVNVVVPLLHYSFLYDSTGTLMPEWTESLG